MGDFNAKVGKESLPNKTIGKYGLGERNKWRKQLKEFALKNNLKICNTFLKRRLKGNGH